MVPGIPYEIYIVFYVLIVSSYKIAAADVLLAVQLVVQLSVGFPLFYSVVPAGHQRRCLVYFFVCSH